MPRPSKRAGLDDGLLLGLEMIRLLRAGPIATWDLARTLGVSRDTVDRLLAAIRKSGLRLYSEKRGSEVLHALPPQTLSKVLP